jgi:hypothetical protein
MKKLLVPVALVVAATPASSIELGIGVELARTNQTIYLPIKVSEDVRVEPFIAYTKTSRTGSAAGEDFGSIVGIGIFGIKPKGDALNVIYGARLGHQSFKQEYTGTFSYRSSGYLLSPTVGFEYFVTKSFAVGAEVAITYTRTKRNDTGSAASGDGATRVNDYGTSLLSG